MKELLQNNGKINSKNNIPLTLTYNRTLQNISEVLKKIVTFYRSILTLAFKRNKNMQDFKGGHLIKDEKIAKRKLEKRQGRNKTWTCITTRSDLCCMQKGKY